MKKAYLILVILGFSIMIYGQNKNISEGNVFDGEPYLTINPNNSQHFVVAWMGWLSGNKIVIKTKVSFDAGKTWGTMHYLAHTVSSYTSADASIDFDHNGNVYISYIDYNTDPTKGGIYLCKSTDGGLSWESPVKVFHSDDDPDKLPIDRPWIAIDRSTGSHQGSIYITSMNAKGVTAPYNPYLSVSTDLGNTFNWRYLDTTDWLSGNAIPQAMPTNCIASDGIFYSVYPSYVSSQNAYAQFIMAKSTDAGNKIVHQTVFSFSTSIKDTLAKRNYLINADPSDASHLIFVYLDVTYGDIDVFMCESFNKGDEWSNPIRINDDAISNNRMQDLVWADFDTDGDIVISWRDRRNATDSTYETSSEIYAAYRKNGDLSFSNNFKISDQNVPYDSILSYSGNDFMHVKLQNDTINAVWGDVRTGKLNIWFQRTAVNGVLLSKQLVSSEDLITIYPNPSQSILTIEAAHLISEINIFDLKGRLIYQQYYNNTKKLSINVEEFPIGLYNIHCKTSKGVSNYKFIKE